MEGIITKLNLEVENSIFPIFRKLEDLGIIHVGHGIIKEGKTPTAIYSHHEWATKYCAEQYYKFDPLRLYAINTDFKIIPWDSLIIEDKKERMILQDRMRICSVTRGILICSKTFKTIETMVVGTDSSTVSLVDLISNIFVKHYLNEISQLHRNIYSVH